MYYFSIATVFSILSLDRTKRSVLETALMYSIICLAAVIEIYRMIFQGIEAYQHLVNSGLIRTGLDLSLFLFCNNLFDFSNLF